MGKPSVKELVQFRCPECTSTQVRFRLKAQQHVCLRCGRVWAKEEGKET